MKFVFLARFRCQIWLIWYKDSYAEKKKKKALLLPLEIEVALHIYLNLNPCKNFIFTEYILVYQFTNCASAHQKKKKSKYQ